MAAGPNALRGPAAGRIADMHLHLLLEGKIEERAGDGLDLLDQARVDAVTDDDIEANLPAGTVEFRGDATFAFGSACKVRGNVDHRDEALRVSGDWGNLGHCVSPVNAPRVNSQQSALRPPSTSTTEDDFDTVFAESLKLDALMASGRPQQGALL